MIVWAGGFNTVADIIQKWIRGLATLLTNAPAGKAFKHGGMDW